VTEPPEMIGEKKKGGDEKVNVNVLGMLSMLVLMLFQVNPVYATEDNGTVVNAAKGIPLTPPPDEALTVPEVGPAQPNFLAQLCIVIGVAAFIGGLIIIARKRNIKVKSSLQASMILMIMVSTFSMMPVVAAQGTSHDFGNPLDTSNIGLFAYFKEESGWTLADTVPAFEGYTDHGNYYDGIVRVWQDQRSDTNFLGSDVYIDIQVRVRGDGWILAWMTRDQDKGNIVFWGRSRFSEGNPVIGATTLSRAMQRVYHAAGKEWVGHSAIKYYDYEFPEAGKLVIFGGSGSKVGCGTRNKTIYCVLPAGVTVYKAILSYGCGSTDTGKVYYYIDGEQIAYYSLHNSKRGWIGYDVTQYFSSEEKHALKMTIRGAFGKTLAFMAIILWMR